MSNNSEVSVMDMVNLPYPLNCAPIEEQRFFASLFKIMGNAKKVRK